MLAYYFMLCLVRWSLFLWVNKAALVQEMAWRRIGNKPLPEPMLPKLTDAYMRQ